MVSLEERKKELQEQKDLLKSILKGPLKCYEEEQGIMKVRV
jgi:hypothetical protein